MFLFINIKKRPESYAVKDFNRRAIIKLKSTSKKPQVLKGLVTESEGVIEIRSFELVKLLVERFFFTFGKNDTKELVGKIDELIKSESKHKDVKKEPLLKQFMTGVTGYDIEKEEAKVQDLYDNKLIKVSPDAGEWLKNNVSNIYVQVPSHLLNIFTHLWGDDVKHKVIDTTFDKSKKWYISSSVSIKTHDGMPGVLTQYFKDGSKQVNSNEFTLGLIRDFGPDFYLDNKKKKEEEITEEDKRKKKKSVYINTGDVEKNLASLNHALGNNQAGAASGVAESVDTFDEDSAQCDELEKCTKLSEDSKAFESK